MPTSSAFLREVCLTSTLPTLSTAQAGTARPLSCFAVSFFKPVGFGFGVEPVVSEDLGALAARDVNALLLPLMSCEVSDLDKPAEESIMIAFNSINVVLLNYTKLAHWTCVE